jgi:hypothetical protein
MTIHVDTFGPVGGYAIETEPLTSGQMILLDAILHGILTVDDIPAEQHAAIAGALIAETKFDPHERRDSHGRWTRGGGATAALSEPSVDARELADLWVGAGSHPYQHVDAVRGTMRVLTPSTQRYPDDYYPKDDTEKDVNDVAMFNAVRDLLGYRIPDAQPTAEPLYRGLTTSPESFEERHPVGSTMDDGLSSWTPDATTAVDFASGKYGWSRPGTEATQSPGTIMRVHGLPAVPVGQESSTTDPTIIAADERLASGRYRVTAIGRDSTGNALVDVEWEGLPYDPAEVLATRYESISVPQANGTMYDTMGITRNGVSGTVAAAEARIRVQQEQQAARAERLGLKSERAIGGLGERMSLDLLDEPVGVEEKRDYVRDAHGRFAHVAGHTSHPDIPPPPDVVAYQDTAARLAQQRAPKPVNKVRKPAPDAMGWAGPKDQGAAYVPTVPDSGTWPRDLSLAYEEVLDDPNQNPWEFDDPIALTRLEMHAFKFADKHGLTNDEASAYSEALLKRAVSERMQDLQPLDPWYRENYLNHVDEFRDGAVMVAVPSTAVGIFNDPDHRFKTQFETGRSNGALNPHVRAVSETAQFNHAVTIPPEKRTVYGYMAPPGLEASSGPAQYGNLRFKLKPHMRDRSTMTVGDSLSTGAIPMPVTGEVTDTQKIRARALRAWLDSDAGPAIAERDPKQFAAHNYAEAQIHGGVALDDVEAIHVSGSMVTVYPRGRAVEIPWSDYFQQYAPILREKDIKVFNDVRTGPSWDAVVVSVPIDLGEPA